MRQPVELTGPGATAAEVAAALGVTPERQAAILEILNRPKGQPSVGGPGKKRSAAGK